MNKNKIEVEAYNKLDGFAGMISFTREEIEELKEECSIVNERTITEGYEIIFPDYGYDPQIKKFHWIRASKEFTKIWNSI